MDFRSSIARFIWLAATALAACGNDTPDDSPGSGASGGSGGAGNASGADSGGGTSGGGTGGGGSGGLAGSSGEAGQGGLGPIDDWENCPTSEDYPSDAAWPHTLEVTSSAVYCATFDENRTLKQELAAKAQLRVAPGSYRLPGAEQTGLGLPICLKLGAASAPVAVAPESVSYQSFDLSGTTSHRYDFSQRAPDPERRLSAGLAVALPGAQSPGFLLAGTEADLADESQPSASFVLCQTLDEACTPERVFDSCTHESSTLNRHDVELAGGSVSLELRIGSSFASTEPGAFVRASGSFRGQDFDQSDYFKLIYRPAHHHFERYFAVLFDEPIDGVCGVQIDGLEPFDDFTPDQAFAVDCELNQLETLEVTSHSLTQGS
jgi:hypothetical protein